MEVIVTCVIGTMLVAVGGLLLVNMDVFMRSGEAQVEQTAEFRAGRQMIAAALREAVAIGTALPANAITFQDINANNITISRTGTDLYVGADFIIGDVTALNFAWATVPFPAVHQSTWGSQVDLVQRRQTDARTGAIVMSTGSFVVQLRNMPN